MKKIIWSDTPIIGDEKLFKCDFIHGGFGSFVSVGIPLLVTWHLCIEMAPYLG